MSTSLTLMSPAITIPLSRTRSRTSARVEDSTAWDSACCRIRTLAASGIIGAEAGIISRISAGSAYRRVPHREQVNDGTGWRQWDAGSRPEELAVDPRKQARPCRESYRQPPLPGLGVRSFKHPCCFLY